jgi:DNA-binding response OmpR family regulator
MTVILLTVDLTVVSRVQGAAAKTGAAVRVAANEEAAIELCAAESTELLIVDLSAASLDIKTLVEQVRKSAIVRPRIVAFGPHVHEDRLAAARGAGCDQVISRGGFFAQLDSMLRQ